MRFPLRATTMHDVNFKAVKIDCSEAIDWEIMQVLFDSMEEWLDEDERTGPYLLVSVNFEFGREVSVEFHDGVDYRGGRILRVELWRRRVLTVMMDGPTLDISFELTDQMFNDLRYYLAIMIPKRSFRDHCLAEYGPAIPPASAPDDGMQ